MRIVKTRLVCVGDVGRSSRLREIVELTVDFQNPASGERKILLDVGALYELSDRAQGRKSREYSTSTVAAGVKLGASTVRVARAWLGRR